EVLDALTRTVGDTPPLDPYWETLRRAQIGPFTEDFEAFVAVLGGAPDTGEASNNWVVGPQLTASGAPIVANDPHLRQSVPSLWYVADVAGGGLHVAGATLPGLPGMPIGHSEQLAWGLTNVMADTVDLVVLERDGETGYVLDGERRELRAIPVHSDQREGPHVSGTQWSTEVGPVITELQGTHLVALRWATLELSDTTPQILRSLATSSTVDEALAKARSPMSVAQNVAIADTQGSWGWQVVGSIPERLGHTGRVPYPGSEPGSGWGGWLEALPGAREPEDGFVITANARPDHPLADAISTSFVPDHRQDRIRTLLLEAGDQQEPADQHRIQLDELEVTASRYLPALLEGIEPSSGSAETCLQLLRSWDHVASADSAGAAVWALFHRELLRQALVDDIGDRGVEIYLQIASSGRSLLEAGTLDGFIEDRGLAVDRALDRACTQLSHDQGSDPALWTYGALHPLRLQHPFARRRPKLLARWNLKEIPWGGTGATVAAAGYSFSQDGPQLPVTGMPSLRIVMPLDDLGASTLIHPGGQSGMPGHVLYASHFLHYVSDSTLPLLFDDAAIHGGSTLSLVQP
ncbi:MAG TPA: penicillin acylase family protein, partial [Deltaproteobacteria bacterium]|nr:penicillin acylase family protein [Deltaproteobacteria bacterium]